MNTPWGRSDSCIPIECGVSWVGTPSHGGLAVTARAAERLLSIRALSSLPGHIMCERCEGYYFFEEDCAYAIAFYEHPEWRRQLDIQHLRQWRSTNYAGDPYMLAAKEKAIPVLESDISRTNEQIREDMAAIIREWFPEYFALLEPQGATDENQR